MTALKHPQVTERIAVLDIAPTNYDHDFDPIIDAMLAVELNSVERRSHADDALKEGISDNALRAFLLHNLDMSGPKPHWRCNLIDIKNNLSAIISWPSLQPMQRFSGPALFMKGAKSDYVASEGLLAIEQLFEQRQLVTIENSGHWIHAEAPETTRETLRDFLP